MKNLVVLKFGGSSMGDSVSVGENLPKIAEIIKQYKKEYKNVGVVVSALAGETRRLVQIADLLKVDKQKKDEIMAQGEIFSSHLLSTYLNQNGVKAVDMNGDLLPIHTNDVAGGADVKKVDTDAIKEQLQDNVVIIPGFIGKNSQGNIATLGFDGSDTTALAVASAMQADRVCLFKDVNGIYSANPRKVKAQRYEKLSLDDMWYFARAGAMIIHPKAIETAIKNNLDIHILPNFSEGSGTLLTPKCTDKDVLGVTYMEKDGGILVSVVGKKAVETEAKLREKLSEQEVACKDDNSFNSKKSFSFALENKEQLEKCLQTAHSFYDLDSQSKAKARVKAIDPKQIFYDPAMKVSKTLIR